MTPRILIIALMAIVAIAAVVLITHRQKQPKEGITKQQLLQKFQTLKSQYEKAKAEEYNVSEIERLEREAREAFDRKDYKKANELLDKAYKLLEENKYSSTPTPSVSMPPVDKTKAMEKLFQVKVASLYERITDGILMGRSADDVINIFNETNTDLIFRGFFRWEPVPESSDATMSGYPANYARDKTNAGYTYQQLGEAINRIKTARPDIIFVGAIAAQRLNKIEYNDATLETFSQTQTWEMALDPKKFNFDISKEELQDRAAKFLGWTEKSPAYFPDITNKKYQELLLSRAKKQIDLGADAIWIDMLFAQASLIDRYTGDPNHPAVKESYEAASKIVDEIHAYGYTKYNKYIYVGTWWTFAELPYSPPDIDFVTASPKPEEITGGLNDDDWNSIKDKVTEKMRDVPIFAFIDWGGGNSPTVAFSQTLNPAQQREFLKKADDFFTKKGIIFVFPVHGGTFGASAKRLSFGYLVYDSLAPEFQTYETIKELAQNKSKQP